MNEKERELLNYADQLDAIGRDKIFPGCFVDAERLRLFVAILVEGSESPAVLAALEYLLDVSSIESRISQYLKHGVIPAGWAL